MHVFHARTHALLCTRGKPKPRVQCPVGGPGDPFSVVVFGVCPARKQMTRNQTGKKRGLVDLTSRPLHCPWRKERNRNVRLTLGCRRNLPCSRRRRRFVSFVPLRLMCSPPLRSLARTNHGRASAQKQPQGVGNGYARQDDAVGHRVRDMLLARIPSFHLL